MTNQVPIHPANGPMDINGVCAMLRRSRPWVYRAIKTMGLPARRMGTPWVFDESEVRAWLKSLSGANVTTQKPD